MIDVREKKQKILSFLQGNGPSLPVRIAKEIDMSPVFASAILAELLQSKDVVMSHLKVGSSSLYLIPGTESRLEGFIENLKGIEKETLMKLQKAGELFDDLQEPGTRIALRNLRDFAKPSRVGERILWKYAFVKGESVKGGGAMEGSQKSEGVKEEEIEEKPKIEEKQATVEKQTEKVEEKPKIEEKGKVVPEDIFDKSDPQAEDFGDQVVSFIEKKGFIFVEKIQSDKKEFVGKVSLPTKVGKIEFLLVAKNKRTTTKDEISSAIQRAEYEKMPCLYVVLKDPPKSIKSSVEGYINLFKLLVLE